MTAIDADGNDLQCAWCVWDGPYTIEVVTALRDKLLVWVSDAAKKAEGP